MSETPSDAGAKFLRLVEIMARLRAPGGCPWDLEQSFDSIKPYLLEETYEVMDAIDRRDWPALAEELGDLLLQPVFFSQMAADENLFTIADALDAINLKLVRRHPHVFSDAVAETAADVKVRWDQIKQQERAGNGIDTGKDSLLDGVPRAVPALVEALAISKKAANAGFEWPEIDGVVEKLREETAELAEARAGGDASHIEHETGDLLFALVNIARFLKVDPEQALRKANARFRQRFACVERAVAASGAAIEDTPLEQLEAFWQQAKRQEDPVPPPPENR